MKPIHLPIRNNPSRGFTLIEVVVSMFLLAVLSIMAWQGTEVILSANARSEAELSDEIKMQKTWQLFANDLIHLRSRPFSDGLGGVEAAYETGLDNTFVLRFTRGGEAASSFNPTGLTRIQYVLEEEDLYRFSMPAHLSPREVEPNRQLLIRGVSNLQFEHLDRENYYIAVWPPLNDERSLASLPPMIRITLELSNGNITTQTFPGVGDNVL